MSVDVRVKDNGRYEVRWREPGGRRRGRTISRKRDADRFAERVRRELELGGMVTLDEDIPTLAEFVEEWWRIHAIPNLAPNTRDVYAHVWAKHILPRLGGLRLRQITPGVVNLQLVEPMRRNSVGEPTIRKTLAVLQSILALAVVHDHIPTNPAGLVRKPPQQRREANPLWPTTVEAIRRQLSPRDATLVSVLAYAGLRPEEALALRWGDIRRGELRVERAVAKGEIRRTKTGQGRTVTLLQPLAQDLAEHRLRSGRPQPAALVFPRRDGAVWRDTDWRNWRRRVYREAAKNVGLPHARPYDLRSSFVSLLIHEGRSVVEVAEQAGHTAETSLRHYARLFREAPGDPAKRVPAEQTIRAARETRTPRTAS